MINFTLKGLSQSCDMSRSSADEEDVSGGGGGGGGGVGSDYYQVVA